MLALAPVPVIAQESGNLLSFLPLILIVVVFYFLLIRPQQKRARTQRELISSLEVSDRVVTIGGIYGTIRSVDDDIVRLEVSSGTTITIAKHAVSRKVNELEQD